MASDSEPRKFFSPRPAEIPPEVICGVEKSSCTAIADYRFDTVCAV